MENPSRPDTRRPRRKMPSAARGSRLLGRRRAGTGPRVGRRGERGPGYRAVSLKRRREIFRYWLSVRSWPVQRVIADGSPGEQRGRERHSGGDGHRDREAGRHSGRVFEGGAGKPRGEGESRDRDHLAEARKSVVNGGPPPREPWTDALPPAGGGRGGRR